MTTPQKVWCLRINHKNEAQDRPTRVPTSTDPEFYVADLMEAIKQKMSKLKPFSTEELTLWRLKDRSLHPTSPELKEPLTFDGDAIEMVLEGELVKDLAIVTNEVLLVKTPSLPPSRLEPEEEEEARDTVPELPGITRRNKMLAEVDKETISIERADGVKLAHERVFTGRLTGRHGHPVAVFDPDLALLQHRLQSLDSHVKTRQDWPHSSGAPKEFTPDQLRAARSYFDKSRVCYASEKEHRDALDEFFETIFGESEKEVQSRGSGPSKGSNRADVIWKELGVREDKNHPGLAGDASLQALVWYTKNCYSKKDSFKYYKMPIMLIATMGNVLEISIAVCLEEVIVKKILDFEILDDENIDETILKLALIASALKECGARLRAEYSRFSDPLHLPAQVAAEDWHLPRPSAVPGTDLSNSYIPQLKFKAKLDRNNKELLMRPQSAPEKNHIDMRSLYLANLGNGAGEEVVVKFATTYNKTAHNALAEAGFAPRLYSCEPLIGCPNMVVMERVLNGTRMFDAPKNSLPRKVFEDLESALKILHDKDLVFGDLRNTNVMLTESDGTMKVKLIDFDWTGIEGVERYPASLNSRLITVELAPDVEKNGFMSRRHDAYALANLISLYCDDEDYKKNKRSELLLVNEYTL